MTLAEYTAIAIEIGAQPRSALRQLQREVARDRRRRELKHVDLGGEA